MIGRLLEGTFKPNIVALVWRFFQLILAIVVIGLYAQDLNKAHKEHKYSDGKWVFVVVTSSLSAVTALAYMLLVLFAGWTTTAILFAWDWVLTVLWAAVLGIFGSMYFHEDPEMDAGITRMKHAAWVDLVNLLLWLIAAATATAAFFFFGADRAVLHKSRKG